VLVAHFALELKSLDLLRKRGVDIFTALKVIEVLGVYLSERLLLFHVISDSFQLGELGLVHWLRGSRLLELGFVLLSRSRLHRLLRVL